MAVIFVGEDLDVLIELCDRILVIGSGRVRGDPGRQDGEKEEIGLLMTGSRENTGAAAENEAEENLEENIPDGKGGAHE